MKDAARANLGGYAQHLARMARETYRVQITPDRLRVTNAASGNPYGK